MKFPHPCGADLATAVQKGADPKRVVLDTFVVLRGERNPIEPPGTTFSATAGPTVEAAAAALPHGFIRVTTAGAIRARGGIVEWAPEVSRHGTLNQQHVNVTEVGVTSFSEMQPNPIPRPQRVDGDKK
jgi:hypothetical protein